MIRLGVIRIEKQSCLEPGVTRETIEELVELEPRASAVEVVEDVEPVPVVPEVEKNLLTEPVKQVDQSSFPPGTSCESSAQKSHISVMKSWTTEMSSPSKS